jgi:hypothetical protein
MTTPAGRRPASPRAAVPRDQIHPALADLLVNRGEVSPDLARTAALAMARAGRGLSVEDRDGVPMLRLRDDAAAEPSLLPFEKRVIKRVRARMGDRMDHVPAAALGPGDGYPYTRWRPKIHKALLEEAVEQGLMRRMPFGKTWRTGAGFRAALWWRWRGGGAPPSPHLRFNRRLSARTGWPLRYRQDIWSPGEGAWHIVPTAPLWRPAWGAIWNVVLLGLAALGALALDLVVQPNRHRADVAAVVGILTLATLGMWLPFQRRIRRVPTDATFRGTVVCRFDNEFWDENNDTIYTRSHCSVEDPAAGQAWTFRYLETSGSLWRSSAPPTDERIRVGDVVDIRCNPRRRTVRSLERVDPAVRASDPA